MRPRMLWKPGDWISIVSDQFVRPMKATIFGE